MLLFDMVSQASTLVSSAASVTIPDPGAGSAPPGFRGFITLMSWAKYLSLGVCVIALVIAGARIAFNSRRGDGGETVSQVGNPLLGTIVVAAAFSAITALAQQAIASE